MFGGGGSKGGDAPSRRNTRQRKVSQRMAHVDDSTRQQAAQARLDAFEADNNEPQDALFGLDEDDEEFNVGASDEEEPEGFGGRKSKKRKAAASSMRKTRGMLADRRSGPKSFAKLLEESGLQAAPGEVNYLTIAAGPSTTQATRKFCSVCGFASAYTCVRCGTRYCSRKCYTVHTDTRCLKFMA